MDTEATRLTRLLVPLVLGRPAATELAKLVREAEFIARVRVITVARLGEISLGKLTLKPGLRCADAVVVEPFKNLRKGQTLRFLAEATWRCDSSDAVAGETALLFLGKWDGRLARGTTPLSSYKPEILQLDLAGCGRMPITNGAVAPGLIYDLGRYFPRPKGVEKYQSYPISQVTFEKTVRRLLITAKPTR
nr:hypothetical protein [Armatimonas sp.]